MMVRILPFVLSVIAGASEIIGVLGFDGLFTAHITGNLVMLAARIVVGNPAPASYILSVPVFMLVLLLAGVMARAIERTGRSCLQPLLLLQLLALLAFLPLGITAGPWQNSAAVLAITAGMCAVAAMAAQNALVQIALKHAPTTAVITTNTTRLILDLTVVLVGGDAADVAKAKGRDLQNLPVIIGFGIGCALGAAGEAAVGLWSIMLPTVLALLACIIGMERGTDVRRAGR
jgi:uncharacterized membrane protein YoaK (UPF0700 family)